MNNTITLVGRVVQEPVKKTIPAKETTIAEFSLAVKDYSKKGLEHDAIFFDIKAFNGNVDRVMEYISKGREVVINGRVAVEDYKRNDGTQVLKYVVILNGFHLCGSRQEKTVAPAEITESSRKQRKSRAKIA